jgi:type IX secretion system PorP/SprF family membrane protein
LSLICLVIDKNQARKIFTINRSTKMKRFQILKSKLALILLTVITLVSLKSQAQQDPMYSQYMFNTLAVNPAYAGSRDVLSMTALARYQWLGVIGAPITYTFSVDMPISKERMGFGLQAFKDDIGDGVEKTTGGYFTYAYKVRMSQRTTLSLGTQVGFTNYVLDLDRIAGSLVNPNDFAFVGQSSSQFKPNVGFGLYMSNDKGYIGLSVPNILEYKLTTPAIVDSLLLKSGYTTRRSYFAMMGFVIGLSNTLKLKPSLMGRYQQGAPLSIDANMNLWIKDKISIGVSGRFNQIKSFANNSFGDAIIGMFEVQLNPQLRLGYAYDHTLNNLNKSGTFGATQTHEVLLRYEFGYGKNKILTPRYF